MDGRRSIAGLMVGVGLVAAEVAAARAVWQASPELLVGVGPAALAVQAALYRAWRRRVGRAFWLGFAACALVGMGTYVEMNMKPRSLGITTTGAVVVQGGSMFSPVWDAYGRFVGDMLEPVLVPTGWFDNPDSPVGVAARAAIWAMPQVVLGVVGGVVAWGLARGWSWVWRSRVEAEGGRRVVRLTT